MHLYPCLSLFDATTRKENFSLRCCKFKVRVIKRKYITYQRKYMIYVLPETRLQIYVINENDFTKMIPMISIITNVQMMKLYN